MSIRIVRSLMPPRGIRLRGGASALVRRMRSAWGAGFATFMVIVSVIALVAPASPVAAADRGDRSSAPAERPPAAGARSSAAGERLSAAAERSFPSRPVAIVVPYAAGGPTDTVARKLALELTRALDHEVEVRNVPGNGGTRAPAQMAAGAGDGHVLLLHHIGMATAPSLFRQLGYDPVRDFEPVGLVAEAPMVLLTSPQLPVSGGRELVAYVRAHQGVSSFSVQ